MTGKTEEELKKFQLAMRMAGVDLHLAIAETVLLVQDGLNGKGEEFSLQDSCEIMAHIQGKYPNGQFYQSIKIGENFQL
jgi:hypothetical protein